MSEDAELQAKIAALSARINREKQSSAPANASTYQQPPRWSPYGRGGTHHAPPYRGGYHSSPRGGIHKTGFRHRTLVNNNGTSSDNKSGTATPEPDEKLSAGITTHDRGHMQWTNAAVFDKKVQAKVQAMEETAKAKRQAKDDSLKNRVVEHVYGVQTPSASVAPSTASREIIVNDLRFRVAHDGSKLIRIFGEEHNQNTNRTSLSRTDGSNKDPHSTPKETKVAGVSFVRTKNGNLLRQGLLRNKRVDSGKIQKKLCADFTSTGSCTHGNRCRFKHDITKLAICKDFLRHGQCAAGEDCNLSHEPSPHRVPTCLHFLRNACTKPDCPYSHACADPNAPVCKDFGRMGYCEKGATCTDRHVNECPDYTNTGVCRNKKCRLPHIDRAGTLRKAAAAKAAKGEDEVAFDVSSDEEDYDEIDSDDADSEEIEDDVVMSGNGDGHELSQQQDFIPFA
ncbi:hypothetical protein BDZ85DRAFT_256502 [Elsinoe ampelina]|uniref:C3H1-type domain-containing protein n=1 Tax=Elsinoe ampelina TaxID=302913 RepID=A0A6A6GMQ7_9PEZI|nr:hypothetical protein BDZ85DRAFT_256502 [Elsinoe ampelina]